jgi:hypothetical protein
MYNKYFNTVLLFTHLVCVTYIALSFSSCREDEMVVTSETKTIEGMTDSDSGSYQGLYLLNEGNMGSNKCTLDYLDFESKTYSRNIYPERNPNVVKELGDVGNDIQIYGGRIYIVVNCSNKIEVADAKTGVRIGQVNIDNCRYVTFKDGYAYVSSYVAPVAIDPASPRGAIYQVDTASLSIVNKVIVGYQPEEMAIKDSILYVANSGGYRAPNYDNTVSVVHLSTMKQTAKITIAKNLHHIKKDRLDQLWVSSRGDMDTVPSRLFVMKENGNGEMTVNDTINTPCSDLCIVGDSLYFFAYTYNNHTATNGVNYGIVNIQTHQIVSNKFITDGTESSITIPYSIMVNPDSRDIYITDAKNYVSSGTLNCYSKDGKRKWQMVTGDIPAHIALLKK